MLTDLETTPLCIYNNVSLNVQRKLKLYTLKQKTRTLDFCLKRRQMLTYFSKFLH